ncbi:MAG: acyl-CoA dehydrogenase family protein [Acidimicrobiales bacterium]
MNFAWTEEQEQFRAEVVRFATDELNDDLIERDASGRFSHEAWKRCAAFGVQGFAIPAEHGGRGLDPLTMVLALEGLGYGCRDNGLLFALNAHMWSAAAPILRFGTDEQRRRYLPGMCDGSMIGVQGMTEPGSGSDAFSLATTAERDEGDYVLNGTKTFITNAPVADVFVVFASTDPERGWAGLTAFVVDREAPGLDVGAPLDKMGLRTVPMAELTFSDCRVPVGSLLGRVGGGMAVFTHSMDWERSFILASAIGTMERQLERCVGRARERQQFGQPIGKFQAVSHRIVDMKLRLEAGRALLHRLAWLRHTGHSTSADAALVKLFLSESWVQSSLDAMELHGGSGYLTEQEVERDVRDALASRIYSGTSDIQRNVIARSLRL